MTIPLSPAPMVGAILAGLDRTNTELMQDALRNGGEYPTLPDGGWRVLSRTESPDRSSTGLRILSLSTGQQFEVVIRRIV